MVERIAAKFGYRRDLRWLLDERWSKLPPSSGDSLGTSIQRRWAYYKGNVEIRRQRSRYIVFRWRRTPLFGRQFLLTYEFFDLDSAMRFVERCDWLIGPPDFVWEARYLRYMVVHTYSMATAPERTKRKRKRK